MSSQCRHKPKNEIEMLWAGVLEMWPDYGNWWTDDKPCIEGNCYVACCPICGATQSGMGPVGCPCGKWDGVPAAQMPKPHVPLKGR